MELIVPDNQSETKPIHAVWHAHHEATSPVEYLLDGFEARRQEIINYKPDNEHERRLALFKPVVDVPALPEKIRLTGERFVETFNRLVALQKERTLTPGEIGQYRVDANQYENALMDPELLPVVLALHAKECGCGWSVEKRDIFTYTP